MIPITFGIVQGSILKISTNDKIEIDFPDKRICNFNWL